MIPGMERLSFGCQPVVTVGMPVFNEMKTIERSISSVLGQSFTNFRLVIFDNCSTDSTLDLARKAAENDDRVSVFASEVNRGSLWNFQRLLEVVNTTHFAWISGHDVWSNVFLHEALELFRITPNLAVAVPSVQFLPTVSDKGRSVVDLSKSYNIVGSGPLGRTVDLCLNLGYATPALGVFDSSMVKSVDGLPDLKFAPDVVFLTRLAAVGKLKTTPSVGLYLDEPTTDIKKYREKISGSAQTSDTDFLAALSALSKFPKSSGLSRWQAFFASVLSVALWGLRWRRSLVKELLRKLGPHKL
jgi:glycosyltransferase involved in cell wall biosynthesis